MAYPGRKKPTWKCCFFLWLSLLFSTRPVNATGEKEKACSNIDIRNKVENFNKLNNCTVVEGYLRIVLIEKATPQDYANLSFPDLKEITGYLLLYRASGLMSLADLFPNLAVIRGYPRFHNFAIVIYEMPHFQEIGLGSLTDVLKGSIFITKNPILCYLETIDWSRILRKNDKEHTIFRLNKNRDSCPNSCPSFCPKDPLCGHGGSSGDMNCRLCWSSKMCQKVCHEDCSRNNQTCFKNDPTKCCNSQCLGGCFGAGRTHECDTCLRVMHGNRCLQKCPLGTYEYMGRRCLIEQECRNVSNSKPVDNSGDISDHDQYQSVYWKPIQRKSKGGSPGECLPECPSGFMENPLDRYSCVACDKCPKVCLGRFIDNVGDAEKLRGCTIIEGSLQIQISEGANIIQELEENLQSIIEIRDFLKISRSFPLISLNFLKNLQVIRGEDLDRKQYSISILDNQNLQELWDWRIRQNKNLTIKKGKMFFHFNPKLCLNKIKEFHQKVFKNITKLDPLDVSESSNGDKIACDVATLDLKIDSVRAINAMLYWNNFDRNMGDRRTLLGYVLHYKKSPYQNASIFDGRDACGTNVWKVIDVGPNSSKGTDDDRTSNYQSTRVIYQLLPHLEPFTQYAVFVRTYTVSTENKGARSKIIYFKTLPFTPTPPTAVQAFSKASDKVTIAWKPPKEPNGIVTHYIITGIELRDSQEYLNQRDFCFDSGHHLSIKKQITYEDPKMSNSDPATNTISKSNRSNDCCACAVVKPQLEKEEVFVEIISRVEDFIHNNIYIKNPNAMIYKASTKENVSLANVTEYLKTTTTPAAAYSSEEPILSTTSSPVSSAHFVENVKEAGNSSEEVENQLRKFNKTFLAKDMDKLQQGVTDIEELHHFTKYSVSVQACQNASNEMKHVLCSNEAIVYIRTLPLDGADSILDSSVSVKKENVSEGSVFVKWDEPIAPNGLIVSYHIEYVSVNDKNKIQIQCVSQLKYSELRGAILKPERGHKYYLRIRATSLAGEGNWTNPVEFEIEKSAHDEVSRLFLTILGIVLVLLCCSVVGGIYIYKKKFMQSVPPGILYASVNPEYMSAGLVYEADEWEVPREKITLIRELGQGSFGMVYEGRAIDMFPGEPDLLCAVKTVNESASLREQIEFLQEASVMKAFNCHHVVKLLGVVSKGSPTLVIMELMANGDLKSYLRSHRPDEVENASRPQPTLKQIYHMAIQIADGMAYLSAKKFVHRDLAARNCMVDANMTVKIGDFGMTRDIYETDYYRKGGKGLLPVRWMAPESLKDGVFTNQSDVWSYGVVLWEMATLASQPYQGLSNEQVLKYVINGGIMDWPENCPGKLYALMKLCWDKIPKVRPTFMELIEFLLPYVNVSDFATKSFYFDQRGQACSPDNAEEDDLETATPVTPLKSSLSALCRNIVSFGSREALNGAADRDSSLRYFPDADESENNSTVLMDASATNGVCLICGDRTCSGSCGNALAMNAANATLIEEGNAPGVRILASNNGGSRGTSESSKGSKVSNLSNGSVQNGHAHFAQGRTTTC